MIQTTEITSAKIASDNPIHQRLKYAYIRAADFIRGDVLDIGCGEGRGMDLLMEHAGTFTAVDKNPVVLQSLREKFPRSEFIEANIPPLTMFEDEAFDTVVTFQVIEHIVDDVDFVKEISRVLKPGGKAVITTPNIKMSLTRNPWHVREYNKEEMVALVEPFFKKVGLKGVYGDEKVSEYFEKNKRSVEKYKRLDIFNLEHRLPRNILAIPYDLLNRFNRNKLKETNDELVMSITTDDYHLAAADDLCYDFFCVCEK